LPLDTDNDLLVINDRITPAVGEITYLSGRILDSSASPVRNAVIEIWQTDANGAYIHSQSGNAANRDANFQGFGRFLTGSRWRILIPHCQASPLSGTHPTRSLFDPASRRPEIDNPALR